MATGEIDNMAEQLLIKNLKKMFIFFVKEYATPFYSSKMRIFAIVSLSAN